MKKTIGVLLIALAGAGQAWGQVPNAGKPTPDQTYINLRDHLQRLLDEYNCEKTSGRSAQAVQDDVLDENLYGIYEAIIPNAQGVSDNGSAFTYSHDSDKQTLGLSAFFPTNSKRMFFNVGVYTEGSDGIFNIYSSGSWNNNTKLNIGVSRVFYASQFFDKKDCEKIKPQRQEFADSLIRAYAKSLAVDIVTLRKDSICYVNKIDSLKQLNSVDHIAGDTTDYLKKLKEVKQKIEQFNYLIDLVDACKHNAYLIEQLARFDKEKDVLYGYHVFWWNINSSIANTYLNIADSLHTDNARSVNHPTIQFNGSLMWNRLGKKTLQYGSIGISTMRGNLLNDPTLQGTPSIGYDNAVPFVVMDNRVVGQFGDLQKPVWQYTISAYYANFFGFRKSVGLSARLGHNNVMDSGYAPDYKKNYTITAGPIFRVIKEEDFAKATFGVSAGWTNVPYGEKPKDHFAIQAYLAVPFGALIKKSN